MVFVYYFLAIAVILVICHKIIEDYFFSDDKSNNVKNDHAHNLILDIGHILESERGIEQVEKLKPKFEQVKNYYRNNDGKKVERFDIEKTSERMPVQLKVVKSNHQ